MLHKIRSQEEIQDRYTVAVVYSETEAVEYLRLLQTPDFETETYLDIDHTAKAYIAFLLRTINRGKSIRLAVAQYVAWKWLLAHPDADTFPGAHDKPHGLGQRETYFYLSNQIATGEWDRLTNQSLGRLNAKKQ